MRMCVGCRQRHEKKELRRVVRTPEGNVQVDFTGKLSGRGAYLCKGETKCLEKAVKSKALERHLETKINDEVFESLKAEFEQGD